MHEQSLNTPHIDIEPNQTELKSQIQHVQNPQTQPSHSMITQSQR